MFCAPVRDRFPLGELLWLPELSGSGELGSPFEESHFTSLRRWLRWWRICLQCRRPEFDPWVGKISWKRAWQPIPEFLPGESHGQRSLVGYSPRGCKELDKTEWLTHTHVLIRAQPLCFSIESVTVLFIFVGRLSVYHVRWVLTTSASRFLVLAL